MTILVVVMREPEAARLVHWAALVARARRDEAVEVLAVFRADEDSETEVPLDDPPELTGVAAAAADAIGRAEGFLAELPDPNPKEGEEPFRVGFALTALTSPDPASAALARTRKTGPGLLLLGLGEKPKGEKVETGAVPELFRRSPSRTLLLRPGGDEEEDAARILVPVSRGANSAEALTLAVDLAGAAGGSVTARHVETRIGEDAELFGKKVLGRRVKRILSDRSDVVTSKVVLAGGEREGVAEEAPGYDLVLVGTDDEREGRRFLFGTLPDALLTGPDGVSIAVLRRGMPLTTRMQRALQRLLRARVPQMERSDRVSLMDTLQSSSQFNFDFVFLILMSTLIASLGLVANSIPVVIGAMLVAPLMTPLIGAGLSLVQGNLVFLWGTLRTVGFGFLVALVVACLIGLLVPSETTRLMEARAQPGGLDLAVALFSGMAAAYAMSRPGLLAALPGVAIAASLIPPIAAAGMAFAIGDFRVAAGAALLFFTNIIAIVLGAAVSLVAVGLRSHHLHGRERVWARRAVAAGFFLAAVLAVVLCVLLRRI